MSTRERGGAVGGAGEYLTFTLDGEEYGLALVRVREIIEHQPITLVPNAPPAIRGVINLRGAVVPVVDLAARFGLRACTIGRFTCIVIVEIVIDSETSSLGLLVDTVEDVVMLTESEIAAPPTFGTRVRYEHLVGLGRRGGEFVILLDAEKLLSIDELLQVVGNESLAPTAVHEKGAAHGERGEHVGGRSA